MTNSGVMSFSGWRRVASFAVVSMTAAFTVGAPSGYASAASVSLDVPYVPTPPEVVDRMLEIAKVGPQDFVIDLGSGDGRIAIAAVKNHGAKGAMGVDLNPERIAEAKANAKQAGVTDKVEFREQNLFDTDFSRATVLTMYLLPSVNMSLRPKILQLKPGTRVVSHAFDMEDWQSDHYERVNGRSVHLWIVPAQVGGRWKIDGLGSAMELDLQQSFQKVTGTARDASGTTSPVQGKLIGARLELIVGEGEKAQRLIADVNGRSMRAIVDTSKDASQGAQNWKGSRL